MKKKYENPRLEVTEFKFSEHIAFSGPGPGCEEVNTYTQYIIEGKRCNDIWTGVVYTK